ncbi:MAG: hypothetical protein ACLP00_07220 [Terracidiphilus sp.]
MRTNINLSDDVHQFASLYADANGISLSAAVTELIRKAQTLETAEPKPPVLKRSSAGIPLFPSDGHKITVEMVRKAEEETLE